MAPKMESASAAVVAQQVQPEASNKEWKTTPIEQIQPEAPNKEPVTAPIVSEQIQPEAPNKNIVTAPTLQLGAQSSEKAVDVQPTEKDMKGARFEPAEPPAKALQGDGMETVDDQRVCHEDPMAATPKPSPNEGPNKEPSLPQEASTAAARTKAFLQQAKQKRIEGAKNDLASSLVKKDPSTNETPKPDVASLLPAKPATMDKEPYIHADIQQPPKPRGRKKKQPDAEQDASEDNDEHNKDSKGKTSKRKQTGKDEEKESNSKKPRSRAKPASKPKKTAKPTEYEPLALDPKANINKDKGDAMDAYVAAHIACDVHELNKQEVPTDNVPGNPPQLPKRSRGKKAKAKALEEEVAEEESKAKGKKAKAKALEAEVEEEESKAKGKKAKAKALEAEVEEEESKAKGKKAKGSAAEAEPAAESSRKRKCTSTEAGLDKKANTAKPDQSKAGKTAESKARLSRKSCAYKRVLNQKLKEGCSKEDAALAAREVPCLTIVNILLS